MIDDLSRRQLLRAGASAAAAAVLSSPAAAANGRSPLVAAGDGIVPWTWSIPDEAVVKRYGHPSWTLEVDTKSEESLQSWADGGDERYVERYREFDEDVAMALVAAPETAAERLLSNAWVRSMDLDIAASLHEPVTPAASSAVDQTANVGRLQQFRVDTSALDVGLAYEEDMPPVDMETVRTETQGVDAAGSGITVAVIDTGVNQGDSNEVFDDTLGGTRLSSNSWNAIDDETGRTAVADGNGHGSFVAAQIASSRAEPYQGYLPSATVLGVKVLDDDGSGTAHNIAAGIRYAADQGADVACLSLGSPVYSAAMDNALSYAAGAGMVCVVAVGNDRYGTRWVATPASGSDAIAVAAATGEPAAEAQVAYFANHGPHPGSTDKSAGATANARPDLIAPGCKIETEVPTESGGIETRRLTGTSMAAPCVAGGIGQLYAEDGEPQGDFSATYDRITAGEPMPAAGISEDGGHGMLAVQRAVDDDRAEDLAERTSGAEGRDDAHRTLSDLEGRRLAAWF